MIRMFTAIDNLVLRLVCEYSLETGKSTIETERIVETAGKHGITEEFLRDSLQLFAEDFEIDPEKRYEERIESFSVTQRGYDTYSRVIEPYFIEFTLNALKIIRDEAIPNSADLASRLEKPSVLIDYALRILEGCHWLKLTDAGEGIKTIEATETER